MTLGESLRAIRRSRGFSQKQVSEATAYDGEVKISPSALLRIENGERPNPKLATLLPVCEVLDIEIRLTPDGLEIVDLQEESG